MAAHLPEHATAFTHLFARVEHTLRRNGYSREDNERAVVSWRKFAGELGDLFFEYVLAARQANTLISEPPRIFYRERGMQPEVQHPITGVVPLFIRGVCQVRNNIVHGEKFVESARPRDHALVLEANWVLEQAIKRHPDAATLFSAVS
jgi:hypothetical protein